MKQYAADVITKNLLSQVDASGHHSQLLDEIGDHERLWTAIPRADAYVATKSGVRRLRQTTIGWRFICN